MLAVMPFGAAADTYVVVSPDNMHGWVFFWDGRGTAQSATGRMVFGPGNPIFGVGSAELAVTTTLEGQALGTQAYQGTRLRNINALSYVTYQTDTAHAMPFQFDVSYDGTGTSYQGRLVFEPGFNPLDGAILTNTWQSWSPLSGHWWSTRFPGRTYCDRTTNPAGCTWTEILTHWPAATILPAGTAVPGGGAVLFKAGSGWNPWTGYVDGFTIGVIGRGTTTYDFEPACREADGNGDFQGNNGNGNFTFDGDGCRDGDRNSVDSSNRGDGRSFNSTSINTMSLNSTGNTLTITGAGISGGLPVTFVLVAVESTSLTPGWVSLTFSDGYTNAGNLLKGSVLLH
jgi:hypothetical protein